MFPNSGRPWPGAAAWFRSWRRAWEPYVLPTVAVLVAGCGTVRVDGEPAPDRTTYVVEVDHTTEPGEHRPRAVAPCDPGDRVLAGGCAWGEVVDPHDPPLRPLADRPTLEGDGWECEGQNAGVGVDLKTITASAVCEGSEE